MSRLVLLPHVEFDADAVDRRLAAGDVLVPLTVEGAIKAAALDAPILDLDELLAYEEVCAAAVRARDLVSALARPPSGPARFDGVDWNHLLLDDGSLFFARDMLFGQALGRALHDRRAAEVAWVGAGEYEPHLPLHGLLTTLRRELASPPAIWPIAAPGPPRLLRRIGARVRRATRRLRASVAAAQLEGGELSVAAVFATSEWRRFTEPLAALRRRYGRGFEVWYLGDLTAELQRWADAESVAARVVPYPAAVDPDVREFALSRWQAWQRSDRTELACRFSCPALAGEELEPHFRRAFTYTLPRTVQWGRELRAALARRNPALMVGSAAFTYLTAFPYHVAAAQGVPSLALAHAAVPGDHMPLAAIRLACRNGFERENFRRSFPDDGRVVLARDVANPLSYAPSPTPARTGGGRTVAVLTSSPSTEGLVLPLVEIAEFIASLRALADPPKDLDGLRMVFKFHPRYDLSPLLAGLFDRPGVELFPSAAAVSDLLAEAWAVLICNHYGSVVVEAAAAGKPILFLDSARLFYPGIETSAFAAGPVLRSAADLWPLLRRLASSPRVYSELTERCRSFGSRCLTPPPVTLVDALAPLVREAEPVGF